VDGRLAMRSGTALTERCHHDPLLADEWSKAGAKEIGFYDFAVGDSAVQLLLDQVRLALLDTPEPVRDVDVATAMSLRHVVRGALAVLE